ncbi:lipopolysaccharide biosynthesis protein [Modestobacter sp. VKM Ac-2983]|uniref:lipopolysaccharide biosynthesis protein n=1 Tax=Modestobacter sp. VKM Ac-2983 TaxID=3004137 RepID=UPI0022AB8199|nr:lipopolysaccharide biosynthesis protein [Modestobacter sp. VKM Ac-2983]MCZ2803687.1 lipopolysaccharide biosynthesis protein [Modestobacter sp. VKM Ac-2983]
MRSGAVWTALSRVSMQVLQLAASVVLARLLLPEDFGLAAVVTTLAGFVTVFADFGLSTAIVQRETINERILATAFWLNVGLNVVLAVIACLVAAPVAGFFDMPELENLIYLASPSLLLALTTVQMGLLRRRFDFRRLGLNALLKTVVTVAVSVGGAFAGLGPAALILGPVVATGVATAQLWWFVRWRPAHGPDRESLRQLWSYSRGLLGFMFVNYWTRNADNLLVGKVLGAAPLGFYGRAFNLMMIPIIQMNAILSTVLTSGLSRVQKDQAQLGRVWLTSLKLSWLVGAPMSVGLAACAPALVETLFGSRWMPMVPVLVLLSLGGPAQLIGSNTGPLFESVGRTGLHFKLGLVSSVLAIVAIACGLPFGIVGVAAAILIKDWIVIWVILFPALRMAGLRIGQLFRALAVPAGATATMAGLVLLTAVLVDPLGALPTLALQVTVGAVTYAVIILLADRRFLAEVRGGAPARSSEPTPAAPVSEPL